jgi:hypothetical protein
LTGDGRNKKVLNEVGHAVHPALHRMRGFDHEKEPIGGIRGGWIIRLTHAKKGTQQETQPEPRPGYTRKECCHSLSVQDCFSSGSCQTSAALAGCDF